MEWKMTCQKRLKKYYSGNARVFCEYPEYPGGPPLVESCVVDKDAVKSAGKPAECIFNRLC